MTPTEKAWELMDKCTRYHRNGIYNIVHKDIAKEYALIAVDELINCTLPSCEFGGEIDSCTSEYWKEVKQEIEKL